MEFMEEYNECEHEELLADFYGNKSLRRKHRESNWRRHTKPEDGRHPNRPPSRAELVRRCVTVYAELNIA